LAVLVWIYPFSWYALVMFLGAALQGFVSRDRIYSYAILFGFPFPLLFMVLTSAWFRARVILMVPLWYVTLSFSFTQGSYTAAISKAFSYVVAPENALGGAAQSTWTGRGGASPGAVREGAGLSAPPVPALPGTELPSR
jgi:hypothetical protein